jgi:hypothetical protein
MSAEQTDATDHHRSERAEQSVLIEPVADRFLDNAVTFSKCFDLVALFATNRSKYSFAGFSLPRFGHVAFAVL